MQLECRSCSESLNSVLIDLGLQPVANSLIDSPDKIKKEKFYPLKVFVCENCSLVQIDNNINREIHFNDNYSYYSSFSTSWLKHVENLCFSIIKRFNLLKSDLIIEIASNDGYLLKNFSNLNFNVLGVEPSANVAKISIDKFNIPTIIDFFSLQNAKRIKLQFGHAKVIFGLNVLAHVPNLIDFLEGINELLDIDGIAVFEFPHLYNLIKNYQFDTIYHEHYSYLSITALTKILKKTNLQIIDIEKISTHGGSLRVYISKIKNNKEADLKVSDYLMLEKLFDPRIKKVQLKFQNGVNKICSNLKNELKKLKSSNEVIAGYGAAAKGITLLNYSKISTTEIDYIVDKNPFKVNKYTPGTHIPILSLEQLFLKAPDSILILPWNLSNEISKSLRNINYINKIFKAIPRIEYLK